MNDGRMSIYHRGKTTQFFQLLTLCAADVNEIVVSVVRQLCAIDVAHGGLLAALLQTL